jgi:hypothetical protein
MAPKRGGGGGERVEARSALAAVLLADSFTQVGRGARDQPRDAMEVSECS